MSTYSQRLMDIARLIVDNSSGRAVLANHEEDATRRQDKEAGHFIKVNGRRLGRDIELYGFLGEGPMGWQQTLTLFLEGILLAVKALGLDQSYTAAAKELRELGHKIYPERLHKQWDDLF